MLIQVKQKHITNGQRCRNSGCPIALAVLDVLPLNWTVSITPYRCYIYSQSGKERQAIELPQGVPWKILMFDSNGYMEPFGFELDINPNYLRQGLSA